MSRLEALEGMMIALGASNSEKVLPVVTDIVATVLSLAPEEVKADARFFDDLGAESIDLLDLRFRIEDALGLRCSNAELFESCGPGLSPSEFRAAFTVRALAHFVAERLEERK
jgi:acyl carrier protein